MKDFGDYCKKLSENFGYNPKDSLKAVIKIVDEVSHGKIHISVVEGTPRTDDDPASTGTKNVWKVAGYQSLTTDPYLSGIDFKLVNINGPLTDLIEITTAGTVDKT